MNNRLKLFLTAENISQAQFADTINVARGGISHILSGRNKPGYDFLKAVMLNYPNLNMEWLMLGKGTMYKAAQESQPDLFSEPEVQVEKSEEISCPEPQVYENIAPSIKLETSDNAPQSIIKQRNVAKIIILFDDGTYQEM